MFFDNYGRVAKMINAQKEPNKGLLLWG